MTRDEVEAWATRGWADALRSRDFFHGALAAIHGGFDEAECGPAGFVHESDFCEGAREALQRLDQGEPAGRAAHGTAVGG